MLNLRHFLLLSKYCINFVYIVQGFRLRSIFRHFWRDLFVRKLKKKFRSPVKLSAPSQIKISRMVSAEKALISVFFFRNSLLLTLPWIIISCKWKVHLRSVFVWSCHISSLNCPQSSSPLHYTPPPSPPPLQPQSIILVSPLIIHLRSSLPPKRLQTNWSECKYGPSLDFCYLFYHFLR